MQGGRSAQPGLARAGSYRDDLSQALEHLALIAAVEEALDLGLVQGSGRVSRVSGGRGGVESEFLSCTAGSYLSVMLSPWGAWSFEMGLPFSSSVEMRDRGSIIVAVDHPRDAGSKQRRDEDKRDVLDVGDVRAEKWIVHAGSLVGALRPDTPACRLWAPGLRPGSAPSTRDNHFWVQNSGGLVPSSLHSMAFLVPLLLSPALPSELLSYILQYEAYPTTLVICYPRADFLSSLVNDVRGPTHSYHPDGDENHQDQAREAVPPPAAAPLLSTLLYQLAIARHIRMVFIPTVSHLRAYLSVFKSAADHSPSSKTPPLPPPPDSGGAWPKGQRQRRQQQPPLLLVYGFLTLHRDTSEWSAQGVSASAAALVEASRMTRFRAVVVEPPRSGEEEMQVQQDDELGGAQGVAGAAVSGNVQMLAEQMPVLSASVIRAGGDFDDAAWTGRKVTVGRVLSRWFRYKARQWSKDAAESE